MKTGKVIALLFVVSWVIGIGLFVWLRPTFKHGKELLRAVESGQTARVQELLRQGANLQVRDREGNTALAIAAYYDRAEIAEALLARGADPNVRGLNGLTPLMRAAENGNVDVARVLLKYGAKVNAQGLTGETALSLATGELRKPVAELLRQAGAK
jgi:uncharacterized protein